MNSLKCNVCTTAGGPSWNVKGENCCSATFKISLSINLLSCVPYFSLEWWAFLSGAPQTHPGVHFHCTSSRSLLHSLIISTRAHTCLHTQVNMCAYHSGSILEQGRLIRKCHSINLYLVPPKYH